MEKGDCIYRLEGQEFRHTGTMRQNRQQMIANLRFAFPDVEFTHRCPCQPLHCHAKSYTQTACHMLDVLGHMKCKLQLSLLGASYFDWQACIRM